MQIVLLSGGSGKRLWPLSNESRSKQFLPLLQAPDGTMESMVQRVVRQLREAGLTDGHNLTVATNSSQNDIIVNQLGTEVERVLEPERRDTFPAIALACCFLGSEIHIPDDEPIVVMPCDPFTELAYYDAIRRMVQTVEENRAPLALMGIRPTYASPKYGYIVPGAGGADGVCRVQRFVEKPDIARAGQLLAEGAYWNGGVFAFRLGYLKQLVLKYIPEANFGALRFRYSELPKISFDYEVAEKEENIVMVPFEGAWKDLGTWNTLTEELPQYGMGNVVMGSKNENTHVVNQLGIPIFCDGLKDVAVAASPDGILVCAKNTSETIKDYADRLADRPMYEERRWGVYRVIDRVTYADGFCSLTKNLTVKAGKNISYQVHRHRDEVWTFVDGEGLLALDGEVTRVGRGDVVHIKKGQFHAIRALSDLQFVEVQTGDRLVEEDIDRFPWDWTPFLPE